MFCMSKKKMLVDIFQDHIFKSPNICMCIGLKNPISAFSNTQSHTCVFCLDISCIQLQHSWTFCDKIICRCGMDTHS